MTRTTKLPPVQPHPDRQTIAATADPLARGDDGFHLQASCPECGAPLEFGEEDKTGTCGYCGSLLVLELTGATTLFYLPSRLADPERLRGVVAFHHAMRQRPAIVARYTDPEGRMLVPSMIIDAELRHIEEQAARDLVIGTVEVLHAPYRLCLGELGQAFVGREPHGNKDVSFRVYALEYLERGYDEAAVNLRDRGLKISLSGVRLLTRVAARDLGGRFLGVDAGEREPLGRVRGLLAAAQDKRLTPIAPARGELLFLTTSIVYKSYFWLSYQLGSHSSLLLLDGSTEQVAGYPDLAEVAPLASVASAEPPDLGANDRALSVIPSECPICGHDQSLDPRTRLQLCTVCGRALAVDADRGILDQSYHYAPADSGDVAWVPFWRFPLRFRTADDREVDGLPALFSAIWQGLDAPARSGRDFYLPALRTLGHESLDLVFEQLARWATYAPPERLLEGPLPADTRGHRVGVTLECEEAAQVAPLVLYALLDKPRRARINVPMVKNLLDGAKFQDLRGELVWLPLPLSEGRIVAGRDSFSLQLLERDGAELGLRQRICWSL